MADKSRRLKTGVSFLAGALFACLALAVLVRLAPGPAPTPPAPDVTPPTAPALALHQVGFGDLAGWAADDPGAALPALNKSCAVALRRADSAAFSGAGLAGTNGDWRPACTAALTVDATDPVAARAYFEAHFTPLTLSIGGNGQGLFTGYYEPVLAGSLIPDPAYPVPLYMRPPDLVTVDLGSFRKDLKGRRVAGRVDGSGRLRPFPTRADIDGGALEDQGLELIWVKDAVGAFFLHIQGSGRVRLADGRLIMVGYAAPNGHIYTAIGRVLRDQGALAADNISLQTIRQWMRDNPDEADALMQRNASFVFFRELTGDGPVGTQNVVLTPGRSLAIDTKYLPLGAPLWLDTTHPHPTDRTVDDVALQRLMVAQDTGGAIRGAIRGDVFWGPGAEAEAIAGLMQNTGTLALLLPKAVAVRYPVAPPPNPTTPPATNP